MDQEKHKQAGEGAALLSAYAGGQSPSGDSSPAETQAEKKSWRQELRALSASFVYAFRGVKDTIVSERNMKIHLILAAAVTLCGIIFRISGTEWLICIGLFGLVTGMELANTAIEAVVDLVTDEEHPLAGKAKDAAAGAVLVTAMAAAIIGLAIFLPRAKDLVFQLLQNEA